MDEILTIKRSSHVNEALKDRFTFQILSHIQTQPASCCFLLAVVFIALTMAALGLYVQKKEVMPDLDSMKVLLGKCIEYNIDIKIFILELECLYRKIECK